MLVQFQPPQPDVDIIKTMNADGSFRVIIQSWSLKIQYQLKEAGNESFDFGKL